LIGISIGLASVVSLKYKKKVEYQQEIEERIDTKELKKKQLITFLENSDE
jgi:hypothetical protein